ncbi:MAG: inositol monophosphatase [Candidatus Kerfeldbacteria bacterium]|nr:inositol monophosphatase [Candidatus Kerfeldbacteria bacterium]
MEKTDIRNFIIQLGAEAGEYLRNHFYTFKNTVQREVGGFASNVELELETIVRRRLQQQFPSHGLVLVGQEKAAGSQSDWLWVVDALDGSQHFSRSNPIYSFNVAVQHKGETIFGVINEPQTHQLFFAEIGQGAFLNGLKTVVSTQADLDKAYIYVELPEQSGSSLGSENNFEQSIAIINQLVQRTAQVETFRVGAYGQCLVAAGCFDAYVDLSGSSQKLAQAASLLIAREAGANIVELTPENNGKIQTMVTNNKLTKAMREILADNC